MRTTWDLLLPDAPPSGAHRHDTGTGWKKNVRDRPRGCRAAPAST
jgi:hypothetical protein